MMDCHHSFAFYYLVHIIQLRINRHGQNKLLLHFLGCHGDESLLYGWLPEKEQQ